MTCRERLERYFRENGVKYQVHSHPEVYTAQEVAAVEHVPGRLMAKDIRLYLEHVARLGVPTFNGPACLAASSAGFKRAWNIPG